MNHIKLKKKNLETDSMNGLNGAGIYYIYFYRDNSPVSIGRIAGIDDSGLLYIGCTYKQNLRQRLENFIRSKNFERTNNHSGGNKISERQVLQKFFKTGEILFSTVSAKDPQHKERDEIHAYVQIYGEKPPLNG